MKRLKTTAALLATCAVCVPLAACAETEPQHETIRQTVYELPYYDGSYRQELDDADKPQFNNELWRRTDISLGGADPLILDDTAQSGYYYAYVTGLSYYYSSDLEKWTFGGSFISLPSDLAGAEAQWAPEVIYDSGKYYAFFSLTPPADPDLETAAAPLYMPVLAVADKAEGPFVPVDFYETGKRAENAAYRQRYAKYSLFDQTAYQNAFKALNLPIEENTDLTIFSLNGGVIDGGWVRSIDFSPYIDPDTGDRYLYWSQTPGAIAGVKMKDWYTPEWSTYQVLTACGYYTIDDYKKAMNGETVEKVFYEEAAAYCNEGPFMYKHNGKYYLTFSIGAYDEQSYGVMQSVGDTPLGPFRKLTDSENGMILNNDIGSNHSIAGPGHHSFVTVNDGERTKLLISYHAHNNPKVYTGRHVRFDEVKWVTVKDINGKDLDVMHVNGPSYTVQPTFGIRKENTDISDSIAEIKTVRGKLIDGSSADSMIDGLVSYFTRVGKSFNDTYVRETVITAKTTFEITLKKARDVRGIMFYNSKKDETAFESIKDIAFVCEENGAEKTYYIKELKVDRDANYSYDEDNDAYYIIYGGGCYAEFNPINVKSIRFTVDLPEGKSSVGISEVALVGKKIAEA